MSPQVPIPRLRRTRRIAVDGTVRPSVSRDQRRALAPSPTARFSCHQPAAVPTTSQPSHLSKPVQPASQVGANWRRSPTPSSNNIVPLVATRRRLYEATEPRAPSGRGAPLAPEAPAPLSSLPYSLGFPRRLPLGSLYKCLTREPSVAASLAPERLGHHGSRPNLHDGVFLYERGEGKLTKPASAVAMRQTVALTAHLQRLLLSEMIKQSDIDVDVLVDFVKLKGIDPDWCAIQVPGGLCPSTAPLATRATSRRLADLVLSLGKTLNDCFEAAENMRIPITRPSLKRKALGSPPEHAQKRRLTQADATMASPRLPYPGHLATLPPLQTNFAISQAIPGPVHGTQHVNIQPRPPHIEHAAASPAPPPDPVMPRAPGSRRRGRPSRADQSRHLRPVLPQHLTPLAPRTPVAEELPGMGSPLVPAAPLAPSPVLQETANPAKKRGHPPAADKSKPASAPDAP